MFHQPTNHFPLFKNRFYPPIIFQFHPPIMSSIGTGVRQTVLIL
jgi:20S proteasome subunit alpha 7